MNPRQPWGDLLGRWNWSGILRDSGTYPGQLYTVFLMSSALDVTRRYFLALACGGSGFGALACSSVEGGVSGFGEKVLRPENTYVEGPGRLLASGVYSQFALDPLGPTGPHVIGFQRKDSGVSLVSIPFEGGASCDLGPAVAFSVFSSNGDTPRRISYLESPGSKRLSGLLRFGDYECNHYLEPIADTTLPSRGGDPDRFLSLSAQGELLLLDPWLETKKVLAEGVAQYEFVTHPKFPPKSMWLLESGKLWLRTADGTELGHFGEGVREYRAFSASPEGTRWVAAYADPTGIFLVDDTLAAPTRIEEAGCALALLSGSGDARGSWLSYFSPCDKGALALQNLGSEEKVSVAEGVSTVPRFLTTSLGLSLAYLVGGNGRVGTLTLSPFRGMPVKLAEQADWRVVGPATGDKLRALVESDGSVGKLVDIDVKTQGVTELAVRVRPDFALGLLINFDGQVGDWAQIDTNGRVRTLAQGVPLHTPVVVKDWVLALDQMSGETGRLIAFNSGLTKLTPIAEGVPIGGFSIVEESPVALYLTRYTASLGTGQLRAQLLTTGDDLPVSDGVGDFEETLWPKPGVLYSVPSGASQGLWFAAAR